MTVPDLYAALADQLPVFFRPWWLEAVQQGKWHVATIKEQNNIVAVWPYTIEKKVVFTLIRNPPLTPYLGPHWLGESPAPAGWIQELERQIPETDFRQWSCLPGFRAESSFSKTTVTHQQKRTFYLDLQVPLERIWSNIHPKRRNDIRAAEQELRIQQGFMDLKAFISWHSQAFAGKDKRYPYSEHFLSAVLHAAEVHQSSRSYTALDKNGRAAGQIWVVFDRHTLYYMLSAASDSAHRGAIALLVWEAIQEAQRLNLRTFDFEGSMDEGIAFFFRRFGGRELFYDEYTMTDSFLWQLKQKILG